MLSNRNPEAHPWIPGSATPPRNDGSKRFDYFTYLQRLFPLPVIVGIEIKASMATCTNKESIYLHMLGKFRGSQGNFVRFRCGAGEVECYLTVHIG